MPASTRWLRRALVVLPAVLSLAASAQPITVAAAASLTDAFKAIGPMFEAARPGVRVRFNFAASGVLIQQIVQGAPVDVFVSADPETMDRGVEQKVIDGGTRRAFAANTVVLIVPGTGAPAIAALADLQRPTVRRIAIGKIATVPVGRYTRQVLDAAGLWSALQPKLVQADSVRQVLDYVARGEAEAGFVYRTDAAVMADQVKVILVAEGHAPVRYPAAVVSDSRHKAVAKEFVDYLSTPPAQEVLARHGFAKP